MPIERSPQHKQCPLPLRVQGLSKTYATRIQLWRKRVQTAAASDVSFEIAAGTTLALLGSSGSGKSTVARCVTRLEKPDAGDIWLGDTNISQLSSDDLRRFRTEIQMIFQDPGT